MSTEFQDKQLQTIMELEQSFRQGDATATIVPFLQNPAEDERICLTAVTFLTQELQHEIQKKVIAPLHKAAPEHYYYPSESLHVTVQNVRSISSPPRFAESEINIAREVFRATLSRHKSVQLDLRRILELPTSLAVCAFSGEEFQILVSDLRKGLTEASLPDDKRYGRGTSFGSVTVCRFSQAPGALLAPVISELKELKLGNMIVEEIVLISTNAVCHPSITRIIERFPLGN